jgi:hypothetical protein
VAVILPGPLISDIRGRVADVVFERNAGGLYVRSKGVVTQEQSDPRDAARAALEACSTYFRTVLVNAQRAAWSVYATRWPDVDRWGRAKVRTGQQAFISFNFHSELAFQDVYSADAPILPPLPKSIIYGEGSVSSQEIDITCPFPSWPTPAADPAWYIYQGQMIHTTRWYYSSPYRFAGAFNTGNPGWPPFIFLAPVFPLVADSAFYIKLYYNQSTPLREARPIYARLLTVG